MFWPSIFLGTTYLAANDWENVLEQSLEMTIPTHRQTRITYYNALR